MPLAPYSYAYIGIALVLVRFFAGWLWREERENYESRSASYSYYHDSISPFGCFMLGLVGAAIWPLVFLVVGSTSAYDRWPDRVMWLFFHEPSRERRERQLKRRREEIERMEKELGIDA